jgi:hypothetical protein
MRRVWMSILAASVLAVAAFAPVAAQDTITIDIREVDGSGQFGSADVTSDGEQTTVAIDIVPGDEGVPQPANIHEGTCADIGEVAFELEDVVDGVSQSTVDVEQRDLIRSPYVINVQESADSDVSVACGHLPLIGGGATDDDEEATDDDDDAVEEDDDAVSEDDDAAADDDEATEDDDDDDEVPDVVPATGSIGGVNADTAVLMMVLLSSAALGAGVLIRRRPGLV